MSTHDDAHLISEEKDPAELEDTAIESLVGDVASVSLQDPKSCAPSQDRILDEPHRPLIVYTRAQLLYLHNSSLVKSPEGMPALKYWFGDWNEQQVPNKKDTEASNNAGNTRERRFRRDLEDGDASSRPPFRSTLSQPSQMGNFRHQSLRTTDRDKDRDVDRDKERDLRDKEGQERLRNLSDKYDRDRLALSSTPTVLRSKERDSAPHLAAGSSGRLGQAQGTAPPGRRAEGRDPQKRKIGESSEDWRKGAEPPRPGRDDRSDNGRRDRENRERPRSRVRDSSRSKREQSTARRDRDEKDRDRGRDRRGDTDRDDNRRDKEDYGRRDRDEYVRRDWDDRERDDYASRDGRDRYDYVRQQRDLDRDLDEDPRRWRDDGRRDERMAVRRERAWDRYDDRDRPAADDRDGRPKRAGGRERRNGGEEGKERDERRDRGRESEAQPAWMETYVPTTPGGGILGGSSGDGGLDGIQAFKKGMKEREQKENGIGQAPESGQANLEEDDAIASQLPASSSAPAATSEAPLDEIQLFKLMMKREAEKKESSLDGPDDFNAPTSSTPRLGSSPSAIDQAMDIAAKEAQAIVNAQRASEVLTSLLPNAQPRDVQKLTSHIESSAAANLHGSQPPPSALNASSDELSGISKSSQSLFDSLPQKSRVLSSRAISNTAGSMSIPTPSQVPDMLSQNSPVTSSSPSTFNPPPGSRLLAFGARASSTATTPTDASSLKTYASIDPMMAQYSSQNATLPIPHKPVNTFSSKADAVLMGSNAHGHANLGQSPTFGSAHSSSPQPGPEWIQEYSSGHAWAQDEAEQRSAFVHADVSRRTPISTIGDRAQAARVPEFGQPELDRMGNLRRTLKPSNADRMSLGNDFGSSYNDLSGASSAAGTFSPGGSIDLSGNLTGVSPVTSKGSRFAKFFDAKSREQQNLTGQKGQPGPGYVSTSPRPGGSRPDISALNEMGHGESRAMEDIFAMLQNSAQNHRMSPQIIQPNRLTSNGSPFNQGHPELQMLHQQQVHQSQPFVQHSRLDSFYDNRPEDRNFVPDGMVPGLRPVPRSRSRESNAVLYNDQIDDPLFTVQRLAQQQQQQRNLEQMYASNAPSNMYVQPVGMMRNGGIQLQQNQFRGASPISSQNPLQGPSQRLPPGLANLGGRPPHDPSQFMNAPLGVPNHGVPGGIHGASPAQQVYNNFNGGGLGFAGNPPARGPPGVQNPLVMNSMAGMGAPNNMDLRAAAQAQLLGVGGGLRGAGPGLGPQHGLTPQMAASQQLAMRQQQHIPPHMMPHLPPHLQQQGLSGASAQGTQDLMALLMGGHRE